MSISSELIGMKNATAQYKAETETKTTGTTKMGSEEFLELMLKELEYQDPMDPVSNKEFIAQQAQFTQVSTLQEMNANLTSNNSIMQTLSLVGKNVTMVNPEDPTKTISGTVDSANFTSDGGSITIGGKEYPISLIKSVNNTTTSSANETANNNSGGSSGSGS